MIAYGWAVVGAGINGEIDVRTVSPERRGAIVNWLVVTGNVFVRSDHTDEQIERMWDDRRFKADVRVTDVQIEELP